jgi:hypothetical protein
MSDRKDYIKVIIIALITTLVGQLIARAFTKSDMIDDAATKTELTTAKEEVRKESFDYTDKSFLDHEKHHIKEEQQRKERDKLLYLYLEDKFDGLEKLIEAKTD